MQPQSVVVMRQNAYERSGHMSPLFLSQLFLLVFSVSVIPGLRKKESDRTKLDFKEARLGT